MLKLCAIGGLKKYAGFVCWRGSKKNMLKLCAIEGLKSYVEVVCYRGSKKLH